MPMDAIPATQCTDHTMHAAAPAPREIFCADLAYLAEALQDVAHRGLQQPDLQSHIAAGHNVVPAVQVLQEMQLWAEGQSVELRESLRRVLRQVLHQLPGQELAHGQEAVPLPHAALMRFKVGAMGGCMCTTHPAGRAAWRSNSNRPRQAHARVSGIIGPLPPERFSKINWHGTPAA